MCRFISHTGNDMNPYNIKLQQLKHAFCIIEIHLKHTRIRITLSKHKKQLFFHGSFFVMGGEARRDLSKQSIGEYLRLGTHLPHVNRRAENKDIGLLKGAVKFPHVVVDNTTPIPIALVAAQTTPARFDIKIAEIPGTSFGALFVRAFEYFVYRPGSIAIIPWTSYKSHDFHLFSC